MFLKILQNLQENPCTRVSLLIKLQLKKRPWHRCWFFKNSFFYWTPLLAASGKIRTKSLKLEKFQLQLFLTLLGIMIFALHCDIIVVKRDIHIKIFVVMPIYIANQTWKDLHDIKTVCSDIRANIEVFMHSQSGWCFEIVLWMIWVK